MTPQGLKKMQTTGIVMLFASVAVIGISTAGDAESVGSFASWFLWLGVGLYGYSRWRLWYDAK